MKRREFITLASATAAWPFAARAQQLSAMPVVGFLSGRSLSSDPHLVQAFRNGLNEAGFVEGRNVAIEFRWAEGKSERLTTFAADLTSDSRVAVLFAGAADTRVRELRTMLSAKPVVYALGGDPVLLGAAATLSRPGGNATGTTIMSAALWPKRLAFLRELIGQSNLIAVLIDPANETTATATEDIQAAAKDIGYRFSAVRRRRGRLLRARSSQRRYDESACSWAQQSRPTSRPVSRCSRKPCISWVGSTAAMCGLKSDGLAVIPWRLAKTRKN